MDCTGGHDKTTHKTEQLMEINEQMRKVEILSHTAEMLDYTIDRKEHKRGLLLAALVGVFLGLCV